MIIISLQWQNVLGHDIRELIGAELAHVKWILML